MADSPDPSVRAPDTPLAGRRNAAIVLVVLAGAALLVNFIETMLVPALPDLRTFYGDVPYTTVTWVLSIYLLVGVCTTPVLAKLGDLYGKKRMLLVVLAVYTAAVALAPATPDLASALGVSRSSAIYLLIGVRGLQGFGLAMFPLALALVGENLPPREVAPAQGLIASMFAVGAATGLVGGSWLIQSQGWQVAYWIVAPFTGVLALLAYAALPESRHISGGSMDVPGAVTLGGALGSFLLALTLGPSWGWGTLDATRLLNVPLGVPELLVLATALAATFVLRELRATEPMIDLGRFRERNIAVSYLGAMLVGVSLFVAFVVLTVLVEFPVVGLGRSVLDFGIASLPTTVAMFVAAPLVGRGIARFGPRPFVLLGSVTALGGFLALLANHGSYVALVVEAVPTFVGLVAVLVSVTNVIVLSARPSERGIQMGMTEMFQDLGGSIGPIVVSSLLASFTTTYLVPVSVGGATLSVAVTAPSAGAFTAIFLVGAALMATCAVLGLLLRPTVHGTPVEESLPEPAGAPAPSLPV